MELRLLAQRGEMTFGVSSRKITLRTLIRWKEINLGDLRPANELF
jgi:hypothetical protein